MSAEVSLGWDNGRLRAGAAGAAAIVEGASDKMRRSLNGIGDGLSLGAGLGIFSEVVDVVKGGARALADATLSADSMQGGMEALTGSVEAANQRLTEMRNLSKDPGLGFSQVVQGDIALQSAGLHAQLATRSMREMGNALAIVGKGKAELDGVLLALTQIVSKGKVSAEEINQIGERVPQVRKVMQEVFGTADTEAIQKMNIPVERFIDMLVSGFERTVPRALVRMQGKLDNFTDASTARLADFGVAFAEHFVGPLDDATTRLEASSVQAKGFGAAVGSMSGGLLEFGRTIGGVFKFSVDGLGMMAAGLADATLSLAGFEKVEKQTETETVRLKDAQLASARVAADLKRHQDQLAEATKRVAESHKEAAKRANERGKEEAELTAKVIKATNAARDRFEAERNQTADLYLSDQEKLEKVKQRILDIDKDLNKVLGQKGGEELAYKLSEEREKSMQELLRLSKAINDEQNKDQTKAKEDNSKQLEKDQALALYDLELAIAEAAARGHDKKVEKLEREKAIIEETATLIDDMGLSYDAAVQKATRMVDAKERAEDRENGEGGRSKIQGYHQGQGGVEEARGRAERGIRDSRQRSSDAIDRTFGSFNDIDAAQKDKFSRLFGNAPAENGPAKADSATSELTAAWSEWGSKTLELFEKAMQ